MPTKTSATSLFSGLQKLAHSVLNTPYSSLRSAFSDLRFLANEEYDLQEEMDAFSIGFSHGAAGGSANNPPARLKSNRHSDYGTALIAFDAGVSAARSGQLHVSAKFKYFHKEQV